MHHWLCFAVGYRHFALVNKATSLRSRPWRQCKCHTKPSSNMQLSISTWNSSILSPERPTLQVPLLHQISDLAPTSRKLWTRRDLCPRLQSMRWHVVTTSSIHIRHSLSQLSNRSLSARLLTTWKQRFRRSDIRRLSISSHRLYRNCSKCHCFIQASFLFSSSSSRWILPRLNQNNNSSCSSNKPRMRLKLQAS